MSLRPCPVCRGLERERLGETRFAEIEAVTPHSGYEVVCCTVCGACFADRLPSQAVFDRYYAESSKYELAGAVADVSPHDHARFQQEADEICSVVPRSASVLELGCASGGLLYALQERGMTRLAGVDPSPACARQATERLALPVKAGSLFGPGIEGSYDLVVLIGVLEHLVEVAAAMQRIRSLLVDGGIAYVEVPDLMAFESLSDAPFQQLSIEHLGYFSAASLRNLGVVHGFEVVQAWRRSRPHVSGGSDPTVAVALRAVSAPACALTKDSDGPLALRSYLLASERREAPLRGRAQALAARGPLVVWGCGAFCLRAMATTALCGARVRAFVDRNPRYQGRTIAGAPIVSPEAVRGTTLPILIASFGQASSIERQIRQLGLSNELLRFEE